MSVLSCQPAIYCLLPKKVGVCAGSVKRDCFFLNGEYQKPVRLYMTFAVTSPVRCEIMRPALLRRSAAFTDEINELRKPGKGFAPPALPLHIFFEPVGETRPSHPARLNL